MSYRSSRSSALQQKPVSSAFTAGSNSFQRYLQEAINQVSNVISLLIKATQQIYEKYSIGFLVKKQYLHKVIMSLISPVQIKVQYDLDKTCYFSQMDQMNALGSSKVDSQSKKNISKYNQNPSKRKTSNQILDKNAIIKQFRQDLQNIQKTKNQVKGKLIERLQQKKKGKQLSQMGSQVVPITEHQQSMIGEQVSINEPASKYQIISKWIKQQTKTGKIIKRQKLFDLVMELNQDYDLKSAKRWLQNYFVTEKQIVNLLTCSGNLHVLSLKSKNNNNQDQQQQKSKNISNQDQILGKSKPKSNKHEQQSSAKGSHARIKFRNP